MLLWGGWTTIIFPWYFLIAYTGGPGNKALSWNHILDISVSVDQIFKKIVSTRHNTHSIMRSGDIAKISKLCIISGTLFTIEQAWQI